MTNGEAFLVCLLAFVASLLIASIAGGGTKRALWGVLGPFGWVIAAVNNAADRIARAQDPSAPPRG